MIDINKQTFMEHLKEEDNTLVTPVILLNSILSKKNANLLREEINEEKDLQILKEKVKILERKIKERKKPKTVTIAGDAHFKIKEYCNLININIGDWVSKTLIDTIDKIIEENNCIIKDDRDYETIHNEEILKLKEKYTNRHLKTETKNGMSAFLDDENLS